MLPNKDSNLLKLPIDNSWLYFKSYFLDPRYQVLNQLFNSDKQLLNKHFKSEQLYDKGALDLEIILKKNQLPALFSAPQLQNTVLSKQTPFNDILETVFKSNELKTISKQPNYAQRGFQSATDVQEFLKSQQGVRLLALIGKTLAIMDFLEREKKQMSHMKHKLKLLVLLAMLLSKKHKKNSKDKETVEEYEELELQRLKKQVSDSSEARKSYKETESYLEALHKNLDNLIKLGEVKELEINYLTEEIQAISFLEKVVSASYDYYQKDIAKLNELFEDPVFLARSMGSAKEEHANQGKSFELLIAKLEAKNSEIQEKMSTTLKQVEAKPLDLSSLRHVNQLTSADISAHPLFQLNMLSLEGMVCSLFCNILKGEMLPLTHDLKPAQSMQEAAYIVPREKVTQAANGKYSLLETNEKDKARLLANYASVDTLLLQKKTEAMGTLQHRKQYLTSEKNKVQQELNLINQKQLDIKKEMNALFEHAPSKTNATAELTERQQATQDFYQSNNFLSAQSPRPTPMNTANSNNNRLRRDNELAAAFKQKYRRIAESAPEQIAAQNLSGKVTANLAQAPIPKPTATVDARKATPEAAAQTAAEDRNNPFLSPFATPTLRKK